MKSKGLKILFGIHLLSIALMVPLFFGLSASAIADPSGTPSLSNIAVNRNLRTTGDVLVYGEYNIPYSTVPDELASNAYTFQLLRGTEIIGMITPFSFMDNGFNEGVFSFYISANFTWGSEHSIKIIQSPAAFPSPQAWQYVIPASAYSVLEDQSLSQIQLTQNIIVFAQNLELYHTTFTFLESGPGGTVLSSPIGETYFRGAIYGIQSMAPELFLIQILDYGYEDRAWTTDQFDTYQERFDTTWVGASVNATANQFGQSKQFTMGLIAVLPVSLGCVIVSSMKFRKIEPGLVVVSLLLIMFGLMSWIHTAMLASTYQVMAIYIGYLWFYSRG